MQVHDTIDKIVKGTYVPEEQSSEDKKEATKEPK